MAATAEPRTAEGWSELCRRLAADEERLRAGGGADGLARQHKLGRLFVRERLAALLDPGAPFLELGLWAGHGMYSEWGDFVGAGVVTGVGTVAGRRVMIVANDATVKAGAFVPMTCKKILRAQRIAGDCGLPLLYLVDCSGVFLPLQDEVFPDEDDFGRIFRNNAVFSAAGLPQYAAILGNCIAGGAYLPVLCDKVLMTEGSGLYLAGPSLVKAAIGQEATSEELGGAAMHAALSGTIDFQEKDDRACLERLRQLVALLPPDPEAPTGLEPERPAADLRRIVPADGRHEYDVRDAARCLVDRESWNEYKAGYGKSLVCAYARLDGSPVGVVANQRVRVKAGRGELQMPGVIYADAADKAARFVLDCNQSRIPLLFLQDVSGFMVGKEAEQSGIIRSGAKLVNAVSNSTVPKLTVILGGSFGAGNYALCGKAFDPRFIFAWPQARYAVMGAAQASDVVYQILARRQSGRAAEELKALRERVRAAYEEQTDIRYGAARGWVDAIVAPEDTRAVLIHALTTAQRPAAGVRYGAGARFRTGVLQV
ncbi:MAG TPA: acyl-CoA carboxylase subunit beta [Opitutaceae bacterium]|jgi:acetyl-CoA carboxylase carboxyltransferase component|nr:acyl-CoA carboxylase subunit beta [Opitutaceae bacterium]